MIKIFDEFIEKNVNVVPDFSKIADKINYDRKFVEEKEKNIIFAKASLAFTVIFALLLTPTIFYLANQNNNFANNAGFNSSDFSASSTKRASSNGNQEGSHNGGDGFGGVTGNGSQYPGGEIGHYFEKRFTYQDFEYCARYIDIKELEIDVNDQKIFLTKLEVSGEGVCEIYSYSKSKASLAVKIGDKFYKFDIDEYSTKGFKENVEFVYGYDENLFNQNNFMENAKIIVNATSREIGKEKANELFAYFLNATLDNKGNSDFHERLVKTYGNSEDNTGTVEASYRIEFETVDGVKFSCFYHKTFWEENPFALLFNGYYRLDEKAVDIILQ